MTPLPLNSWARDLYEFMIPSSVTPLARNLEDMPFFKAQPFWYNSWEA